MIRERQLKFTGHCIPMPTDEPINRFVLYESKVRPSLRPEAQTRTYRQKILPADIFLIYARSNRNMEDSGEQICVEQTFCRV